MTSAGGFEYDVRLMFGAGSREKSWLVNGERPGRLADAIGRFPVVILSPEKSAITFGPPAERRRFLDLVLSQQSRSYFEDLLRYRHVLRQRNRVLADARVTGLLREDVLGPWDGALAEVGSRVVRRRSVFVAEFVEYATRAYGKIIGESEVPGITYRPPVEVPDQDGVEGILVRMSDRLRQARREECRRGLTLVGPHRDDVEFTLNGMSLQAYASQGQHRTFLVALKLAEYEYLCEHGGEPPILLLDDAFSELDDIRSRRLLRHLAEVGQVIITSTQHSLFREVVGANGEARVFSIVDGTGRECAAATGDN
jgi:DNA replication and repair protein RecF